MANKNFNLEVELTAKIDDLTAKLNQANNKVNNFKKSSDRRKDDIFSGLTKSAGLFAAGFVGVNTAMEVFNGVINTTQTAGDSWALTVGTMQGGLDGFYRTIGTGDWDNLFNNMVSSAAAARDLTAALDELFEQSNSANLNNSKIDLEIAQLERVRNIAKANKDNSGVIVAAEKIGNLELQKLNNQMFVAKKEEEAFFNDITKITGLDKSKIVDFISNYNDANVTEIRTLATDYNEQVDEIESTRKRLIWAGQDYNTVEQNYNKEMSALKSKTKSEVQIYGATMRAYNTLNDEKINNAVKTQQKIFEIQTNSIKQQNANDVAMAKARNKEDDYGNKEATKTVKIEVKPELKGLAALRQQLADKLKEQESAATLEAALLLKPDIDTLKKSIEDWENGLEPVKIETELKGLPKLEKDLQDLETKLNNSSTKEDYKGFKQEIANKKKEISEFTGEVEKNKEETQSAYEQISVYTDAVGNSFNAMSQAMDAVGNSGLAKFFNIIGALNGVVDAVCKLGAVFEQQAAIEQAIAAQKVATAGTTVAANGAVATSEAVKSGAGMPFPFNLLAIAAGVAAVISALAGIAKFETGGIVGGNSFIGDNNLVRVNSGEMILNQSQQASLFKQLNSNQTNKTSGSVEFKIDGSSLVGVLSNHNRKINSYK